MHSLKGFNLRFNDLRTAAMVPVVVLLLYPLVGAYAQRTLTVNMSASQIAARDPSACEYATTIKASTNPPQEDQIVINVFADATHAKAAVPPTDLEIRVGHAKIGEMPDTLKTRTLKVGVAGLADRVFEVWQSRSTEPLCIAALFPPSPSLIQANALVTHTDVIASGEVSNALRSGSTNAVGTGTLGFHHVSLPEPGGRAIRFPWVFVSESYLRKPTALAQFLSATSFLTSGEDLRAVISVAGTTDSVTGPGHGNFAQSILLPANGGNGGGKSVDIEYFPFVTYGKNQAIGPAFRLAASATRWAPDSIPASGGNPARAYATKLAVVQAFDFRLRTVLINRVSTVDENSLSFTIDGGYIERRVGGDAIAAANRALFFAATGDSTRRKFHGWAIGTYLRLRQVVAFADFQCLSCTPFNRGHDDLKQFESLEGLQPIIGFRFEAPLFSVR